ncbi:hypothetical protein SmJEL517_g05221 [Synchytrium microbalum]|uniref:Ribosomal protein S11 n=1 Tax=Synchytrium microbalum TaxID=1806994 RepID=A0A507BWA6_9FUNG|nr:uncharacterized protein SmJEL517_g05221 [Synchytrium microbalum]TPX31458.1 hypothetical protein SmJEL517_g05221 [Synchytrium microbalum]
MQSSMRAPMMNTLSRGCKQARIPSLPLPGISTVNRYSTSNGDNNSSSKQPSPIIQQGEAAQPSTSDAHASFISDAPSIPPAKKAKRTTDFIMQSLMRLETKQTQASLFNLDSKFKRSNTSTSNYPSLVNPHPNSTNTNKPAFTHEPPSSETPMYRLHINAGRNNTLLTLASHEGNVLCWTSSGSVGLRKAARGTSDAGYQAAVSLTEKVKAKGISMVPQMHVILKGFGPGREQAFRAIRMGVLKIGRISDVTPIRHAGCRPRGKRSL